MSTPAKKALIGIDWQLCFSRPLNSLPGRGVGALYVEGAEEALAAFNTLRASDTWNFYAQSRDAHPEDHISFVNNHVGATVFSTIQTPLGPQVLWPEHGIDGTPGADVDPNLTDSIVDHIYKKGANPIADSYSICGDATPDKLYERTSIIEDLRRAGIEEVDLGGLALNYCVAFSALDLAEAGFLVRVHLACCRAVPDGTLDVQMTAMRDAGVIFV